MEDHAQLRYRRIMQAVCETPWAILPSKLAVIVELITLRAEGYKLSDNEIAERIEAARPGSGRPPYATVGGSGGNVAVIPIYGVIMPRATLFSEISGGCSMTGLQQKLQAALSDDAVSAILLDIDSPGGNVALVPETAAVIRNARGQGKPIVAQADTMAASAAYYLASQADEVVVTPSGEVGSIGVIAIHQDVSRALDAAGITTTMITFGENKANGYPYEPLSEDAAQEIQASVDEFGRMFEADVAKGRGVTVPTVHNTFGQGKMFGAQDAVRLGLADRIDTVDATIGRLAHAPSRARVGGRSSAALPSAPDTTGESAAEVSEPTELENGWENATTDEHVEPEATAVPVHSNGADDGAASEFAELKASLDAAAGRLRQADDE